MDVVRTLAPGRDVSGRSSALLVAVVLSILSLSVSRGGFSWAMLTGHLLLVLWLARLPFRESRLAQARVEGSRFSSWLTIAMVLLCVGHAIRHRIRFPETPTVAVVVRAGVILVAMLSLAQLPIVARYLSARRQYFLAGAALVLATGLLLEVPLASPRPQIDVYVFQQEGATALAEGKNPYAISYTNLYGYGTPSYPGGEPTAQPYPPLSFLFSLTSLATGDVRWALVFCHLFAALLLYLTARALGLEQREAVLMATLFFWVPGALFMVESAWTETTLVLALAIFSYCLARGRLFGAMVAAGMALALKQTMVVLVPFLVILWPRVRLRHLLAATLFSLVSYVPFLIWDPRALYEDLVLFHLATPFRPDGSTVSSALCQITGNPMPAWVSVAALVVGLALWLPSIRRHVGPAERNGALLWSLLFAGVASVYLTTLVFSKQAFYNYFYLVHFALVAALCWSRGADLETDSVVEHRVSPRVANGG